jgi:SEC-C motif
VPPGDAEIKIELHHAGERRSRQGQAHGGVRTDGSHPEGGHALCAATTSEVVSVDGVTGRGLAAARYTIYVSDGEGPTMNTALVTLAIGGSYFERWQVLCERSWRQYAERCNYEVVVIREPLDTSARAKARSPAWQKCLVLGPAVASKFDRVVWIDSDIMINPNAPPITDGVPIDKIGAVDESTFPTMGDRTQILESLIRYWSVADPEVAKNWQSFLDPATWHEFAGLPRRGRHIVQTGVLVLSPTAHRYVLEHVYNTYEDVGGEPMNYEMRPLSFEIQERGMAHWLDPRFNALISFLKLRDEIIRARGIRNSEEQAQFIRDAYQANYFLHFAGQHKLMELLAGLHKPRAEATTVRYRRNEACHCGSGLKYKHCHGRSV